MKELTPVMVEEMIKLKNALDKLPEKEREKEYEKIKKAINEGFKESGRNLLNRAFTDKTLTIEEYANIYTKHNLGLEDMGSILMAFYHDKKEECKIVTPPDSNLFKQRKFIKKRFGVTVVSILQAIKLMKEEKNGH